MNVFRVLSSNSIINVGFVAWFSAQTIKTLLTLLVTQKLDLERMVGAGGMPSAHSSMTCAIAIAIAKLQGFSSPLFGLSLAFAAVVMYDAMGVRRAAGEQAKVLNKMIFEFSNFPFFLRHDKSGKEKEPPADSPESGAEAEKPHSAFSHKELKEYLGHTPFEVLGGCLLGILVGVFMPVF